jgi:hypothetical protein
MTQGWQKKMLRLEFSWIVILKVWSTAPTPACHDRACLLNRERTWKLDKRGVVRLIVESIKKCKGGSNEDVKNQVGMMK